MPYKQKASKTEHDRLYYSKNRKWICKRERKKYHANWCKIRQRRNALWAANSERNNAAERKRYRTLRAEVLAAYGSRCCCCGESEPTFLDVDHKNNDGGIHRNKHGSSAKVLYIWAKRNGWPDTLQLLCSNCNQGKNRNGGICPHKAKNAPFFSPRK